MCRNHFQTMNSLPYDLKSSRTGNYFYYCNLNLKIKFGGFNKLILVHSVKGVNF